MTCIFSGSVLFLLICVVQCAPRKIPPSDKCLLRNAAMNGILEIGCWGYSECVDGSRVDHLCKSDTVLERDTMKCIVPGTGHTGCNTDSYCWGRRDGMYADKGDHCQTHFRCFVGKNMGRLYCPADLVFNERYQTCDYRYNVLPPCGFKGI